jgi:hypothetical protein
VSRDRVARKTRLANLPLHDFAQNQIWVAIVTLACEITAWMQMLALHDHPPAGGNPNDNVCGLFRSPDTWPPAPTQTLHLAEHAPWAKTVLHGLERLKALATVPAPTG